MTKKRKKKEIQLIPYEEVIYILKVSPRQMSIWEFDGRFKIIYDDQGRKSLLYNEFKELAHSEDAKNAALNARYHETKRREREVLSGINERYISQVKILIEKYKEYIFKLENIHKKYHDKLDILNDESSINAAYIIYSDVISLLKMACLCLENSYWNLRILLRPIDEAIMLAHYFILSSETNQGKMDLEKWYRENRSPQNIESRKVISEYMETHLQGRLKETFKGNLNNLYQAKSKSIHHTYNGIMEVYKTKIQNRSLVPIGFDYGICSYPRKILEVATFFKSSILTAYQNFFLCFHDRLPLDLIDKEEILSIDHKFMSGSF